MKALPEKAPRTPHPSVGKKMKAAILGIILLLLALVLLLIMLDPPSATNGGKSGVAPTTPDRSAPPDMWTSRATAVGGLFHAVYTPCWEGAYGAIGDAYLFATTNDSSLLRFHLSEHDLRAMCAGRWVDDRAWICLAEIAWWKVTGRNNNALLEDAARRYLEARREGRLSRHEGFWSWYNWPPSAQTGERVFTNSNMNQMATVASELYEATHDRRFLDDALLVWNGDGEVPGIELVNYKGGGRWEGKGGLAAFGKQLPWEGVEYSPLAASLFRATGDPKYRTIAVKTARRILDPATGWVDAVNFYQISMDGNGAFVNFLLDAYMLAPDSLPEIPLRVEAMLTHVWTNHNGKARVTLHREYDHGIRNGWNPDGGEDGYGVDEVGTVHAQGEAARAFGVYVYVHHRFRRQAPIP